MTLQCVAIDDEPYALDLLRDFISRVPFLQLTSSFSDPLEALHSLPLIHPDLLFLDIQMPEISGLKLASLIPRPPFIIFTTAFSQYAVEGFNLNAVDYLLKPFSFERFLKAATKARDFISMQKNATSTGGNKFIIVRSGYQNIRINLPDILCIEAMDNYVRFCAEKKYTLSLMSLKSVQSLLQGTEFIRIHKSYIVNLAHVVSFTKEHVCTGDKHLPIGKTYLEGFLSAINQYRAGND